MSLIPSAIAELADGNYPECTKVITENPALAAAHLRSRRIARTASRRTSPSHVRLDPPVGCPDVAVQLPRLLAELVDLLLQTGHVNGTYPANLRAATGPVGLRAQKPTGGTRVRRVQPVLR